MVPTTTLSGYNDGGVRRDGDRERPPAVAPTALAPDELRRLRTLPAARLPAFAERLRERLIATVADSGGHFAAGLGCVELSVALHRIFDTPRDRLIWDVGHQAYPHKMLTGRADAMTAIRQRDGLSGFPCRAESEFDAFGVAHAGTSISAALGMALASAAQGVERRVVAVIGDGALTAGMAFEALNHLGETGADVLVILNDNQMSISPGVGALHRHFAPLHRGAEPAADSDALFASLGLNYRGPVDGHDVTALCETLRELNAGRGPRLLHVITQKGRGYTPAEADPVRYHGVSAFDPSCGLAPPPAKKPTTAKPPTYTQVFGDWLCDQAAADDRLVAITPAMREGSGLCAFAETFPDRYFDTGIAEQHAVTLAAGFACEGVKPVVAIYSSFLQRAYDQLIHDVALQNLPVLFAIDRGGLVGADGATHHGSFDLSYLRCVPNLLLMAPADENECRQMLTTGYRHRGPAALRYPRGCGPGVAVDEALTTLPVGRAEPRRDGHTVALLSFGSLLDTALDVGERLDAGVVNMRFIKPLDETLLCRLAADYELLVTLEDNAVAGGAGSAVNECLQSHDIATPTLNLGLPDRFIEHATREQQLADAGLDRDGVLRAIRDRVDGVRADIVPLHAQRRA